MIDINEENRSVPKNEPEYEILDTGIFNNNEYFDVYVTYAKQDSQDIFIKINIHNRLQKAAAITVLPTLWFYNRSSNQNLEKKPVITDYNRTSVKATHQRWVLIIYIFSRPRIVFLRRMKPIQKKFQGIPNATPFVKDAFHDAIIKKENVRHFVKKNREQSLPRSIIMILKVANLKRFICA